MAYPSKYFLKVKVVSMWRFVSVLNALKAPSMPRALLRLPVRGLSSETAAEVTTELPALAEGSEVIGPSVFEKEANTVGFPVIPIDRLKELLPKMASVLPKPHDAAHNKLPACIVWRLKQTVTAGKDGLYFVPSEQLKLLRWISPQELAQCITSSARPQPT